MAWVTGRTVQQCPIGCGRVGTLGRVNAILERLRAAAPAAFAGVPVAFAYLFGSHASGQATARSDIDVAVHLVPDAIDVVDHLTLRMELAGRIERDVGAGPVEVVVLDEAPIALAGRIREHGRLFYCVDDVQRVRYESRISREFHDFSIHEERSARERLARLAEPR